MKEKTKTNSQCLGLQIIAFALAFVLLLTTISFDLVYAETPIKVDKEYVYPMSAKDSSVKLSDLMKKLGITNSLAEVKDVTAADGAMITVAKSGSDWTLTVATAITSEQYVYVHFNNGSITRIKICDPVLKYYLTGTDWDAGTISKTITKSGATTADPAVLTNTVTITKEEVSAAGDVSEDGTPNDTVDMRIYARPGMAISFASGTSWPDGSWDLDDSNGGKYKHENWEWIWDSSVNYAKLSDVTSVSTASFDLTVSETVDGKTVKKVCTVEIYIIPENTNHTLLSKALEGNERYSIEEIPVTLYNYDGLAWNQYYNTESNSDKWYGFTSQSLGVNPWTGLTKPWATSGTQVNGGGSVALMGIVKEKLDKTSGLPVMSQGYPVDMFSTTEHSGKEVTDNLSFEFIYDNQTGYYTYNSELNHAQFNEAEQCIQLYQESLSPLDAGIVAGNNSKGGFYPFVDINDTFKHTQSSGMTLEEKLARLEIGVDASNRLFADTARDLVSTTSVGSHVDMHFALQIAAPFYLPDGKKTKDGQDMIYEFTGDDDLWVFIDDTLVLDIGGGHTPVSGSFNITTGEVWIESYAQLSAENGGYYQTQATGTNLEFTSEYLTNLKDDQMHTIKIFYVERHSGESNCRMRFNLPLVPNGTVNVSKALENQDGEDLTVTPDTDYKFRIHTATDDDDVVNATKFVPFANADYVLVGGGSGRTDENGIFTLKAGETARFSGIDRFTEVYVEELKPDDGYVYNKVFVTSDGITKELPLTDETNTVKAETKVMPKGSINYTFKNVIQTEPLTIGKEVVSDTGGYIENQEYQFDLTFTKDCVADDTLATTGVIESMEVSDKYIDETPGTNDIVHLGGTFTLTNDKCITFPRVPVNMTFDISEKAPTLEKISAGYENPEFEVKVCSTTESIPQEGFEFNKAYEWKVNKAVESQEENTVTIINKYRNFEIIVSKTVTGNMGDLNKEFTFECETTDLEGKTSKETFVLKHDEDHKFTLPYGYGVTVIEDDYSENGYTTLVNDTESRTYTETNVSSDINISFENNKTVSVDTGIDDFTNPNRIFLCCLVIILAVMAEAILFKMYKRRRIR